MLPVLELLISNPITRGAIPSQYIICKHTLGMYHMPLPALVYRALIEYPVHKSVSEISPVINSNVPYVPLEKLCVYAWLGEAPGVNDVVILGSTENIVRWLIDLSIAVPCKTLPEEPIRYHTLNVYHIGAYERSKHKQLINKGYGDFFDVSATLVVEV